MARQRILERYARNATGELVLTIAAGRAEELFNHFDRYAPYARKELDPELADYLSDSVLEIGAEPFVIEFRFIEPIDAPLTERLTASIGSYFRYQQELALRELARMGRTSMILLLLGAAIMGLTLWLRESYPIDASVLTQTLAEGMTVAAWVSLWEGLATFLINWAPHRRQLKVYERIASAQLSFPSG